MRLNFKQIYEGWKNTIIPPAELREIIETTSKERMSICEECEFISTKHKTVRPDVHCTDCGCPLMSKTRCLSCSCPLSKWVALTDDMEKDQEIREAIANEGRR
jgi:hypothetical protein